MKTKTITNAGTADEYDSRASARPNESRRPLVVPPATPRTRVLRELEKGDLLAIPLCILWGVGLWLSSSGPVGFFLGGDSMSADLSLLWSWPMMLARYLFGW